MLGLLRVVDHGLYILYSAALDRYYVGESHDPEGRLLEHRNHRFPGAATSKAVDWVLLIVIPCSDRAHARRLERWIKGQKSRNTIQRLLNEPSYRDFQLQRFRTT
jgi:putative endonuclease